MSRQLTYYEYWGLTKPPFDNVPDPQMYFDIHRSVDNAVQETMFAIEEGNECLGVIVGDVGLGKTMTLRVILDSLQQERYQVAFITNPDMTFIQLLREMIGQLTGEECTESRREQILKAFDQVLFKTRAAGKKVLIFIDEANAMKPENLESLRLLTNLQSDDENLLMIIMAGQLELARRLEHPRRANLFQRIGVYCRLHKIESRDLMRDYMEHRLERAGTTQRLFTGAAYDAIWEYSEHGVPRLINRVAKLALAAAQTQGMRLVDDTIVHQIGARFARMSATIPQEHQARMQDDMPTVAEPAPLPAAEAEELPEGAAVTAAPSTPDNSLPFMADVMGGDEEVSAEPSAGADAQARPNGSVEVIKLPDQFYARAVGMPTDQRMKFAGQLAAQVLKKYPHLIQQLGTPRGLNDDPVVAWTALRTIVLRQLEQRLAVQEDEAVPQL
jgi:general secretion pathway protein A